MASKKCFDDQWIVVTGGAGFIGSCVVRQLNDLGYDRNIIIVDDVLTHSKWKNLCGKKFSEIVSYADFSEWLTNNRNDIEAIVHLASSNEPKKMYARCYKLSMELATFAVDYNVRLIYASSAATYGYGRNGYDDQLEMLDSLRPKRDLGGIKHMFDLWALRNKCLDRIVGLKFADVYGPNEYHQDKQASLILRAFEQAKEENRLEVPSFGKKDHCKANSRDFVYVKDVVRIVCEFLFNDVTGMFNIGSGNSVSLSEVARMVKLALNSDAEIICAEEPSCQSDSEPYVLKIDKIKEITSPPSTPLEEGIKDYIQNYLIPGYRW